MMADGPITRTVKGNERGWTDGDVNVTREQVFADLMSEVYEPLQRFVRRRTTDGDDVLADTLLVLWRRLDDIPSDAQLPWSYGVARGCLQNSRRSELRRWKLLRRLADEPDSHVPGEDPNLAAAFAALADGDREVLRLWAWERLPAREIAVVLDISPNAASIRLHRATIRLRTALLGTGNAPSRVSARKRGPTPGQEPGRQGQEAPR